MILFPSLFPNHATPADDKVKLLDRALGELPKNTPEGVAQATKLSVAYPKALFDAVLTSPTPTSTGEPFRLAYTSGGSVLSAFLLVFSLPRRKGLMARRLLFSPRLVSPDPNASMWFLADIRRKGVSPPLCIVFNSRHLKS